MEHFKVDLTNLPEMPKPLPKCDGGYVVALLERMMQAWPRVSVTAEQIALMAAGLQQYPPEILEYITDPRTSPLMRKLNERDESWPPTLAHCVAACVAEINYRDRVRKNASLPPPLPRLSKPAYSVAQSYEEMVKKHGRPIGPFEGGREHPYGT